MKIDSVLQVGQRVADVGKKVDTGLSSNRKVDVCCNMLEAGNEAQHWGFNDAHELQCRADGMYLTIRNGNKTESGELWCVNFSPLSRCDC